MQKMSLYQRRVLAAVISLTSFISSVPVLAAIGKDPLLTALMVPVGVGLATACAALGRRIMRLPRERRRRGSWFAPAESAEPAAAATTPSAPEEPDAAS